MNNACWFFRRPAWSACIFAFHDMGTNDAPVRLGRTYPYPTLINELQRHSRDTELSLSRHVYDR